MSNAPPDATPGEEFSAAFNANPGGWEAAMGVRFVRVTADEVVAELRIGPEHLQAYGIVHGGVYAGLVELTASVGATCDALSRGQLAVGLENHTSFLRACREGVLRATARPLTRGRRTQVWGATVADGEGRAVASGLVRLLALDQGEALAGAALGPVPAPGA